MIAKRPRSAAPKRPAVTARAAKQAPAERPGPPLAGRDSLVSEVRALIVSTRQVVATAVNAALTTVYWRIGSRIRKDILLEKRAGYGEEILQALSAKLSVEFGRGFWCLWS